MSFEDKYVNPLTDFGFKKLFGEEPNKDLLIDFLNQLLPNKHKVKDLTYTKNEHLGQSSIDRKAIFDLYCESKSGDKFIVEIQKAKQNYFKDRSVYYSTFPIQEQAKRGDWDFKLSAVYTIGILDFVFDEDKNDQDVVHKVQLKDQDNKVFYDKLTYIYIELPKFSKKETELKTKFDKWLYVLRHLARLDNRPKTLQEKVFEKVFKAAEIAQFSPEERKLYEDSLKHYRDIKNVVDTSKEEGKNERSFEIAKGMKKDGLSIDKIALYTGLSKDEINKL